MSTEKNDGGAAFPSIDYEYEGDDRKRVYFCTPGAVTLRDYFAAKALAGMLADLPKTCYGLDWKKATATEAYELADAMLKAREPQ